MSNSDGSNPLVNFFQISTDIKIKDTSASRFFDIIGENSRIGKSKVGSTVLFNFMFSYS